MSAQSLPRYMFLHEDSEQMKDKRIQTISYYEDTEGRVEKKFKKRINNTLPLKAPPHSSGIFNLEYSKKFGVMLMATDNEVLVIRDDRLDRQLLQGKQDLEGVEKISFSGSVFLSPDEELLAICSDSLIQIIKMQTLPKITAVPSANVYNCHRCMWVNNSFLLLWNFLGKAYLFNVDSSTIVEMEGIEECTGASLVGDTLLVMEKLDVSVFELGATSAKAKINLSWEEHQSLYYDYSYIVDIFRVNVHGSKTELNSRLKLPLNDDDILGLVMVYYDDDEQAPDQRFLTFYKGNLLKGEKEMRGNDMFYSPQQKRELYYDQDEKIPFSTKILYTGFFITIMIQRSDGVYVVDPFEKYEKINIYETGGKTDMKDASGKFFRGMTVIDHLLPSEKRLPEEGSVPLLQRIVNDFGGEFMTLYFASQETNLNISFPPSVIAITDETFYRKYAVSTLEGIDKDKDEEIIEEMKKIKKLSPGRPATEIKIQKEKEVEIDMKKSQKQEQKILKKGEIAVNVFGGVKQASAASPFGTIQSNSSNPLIKTEDKGSLTPPPTQTSFLFGQKSASSLFGGVTQTPSPFGAIKTNSSNPLVKTEEAIPSLFGPKTTDSIFGKIQNNSSNLSVKTEEKASLAVPQPQTSDPINTSPANNSLQRSNPFANIFNKGNNLNNLFEPSNTAAANVNSLFEGQASLFKPSARIKQQNREQKGAINADNKDKINQSESKVVVLGKSVEPKAEESKGTSISGIKPESSIFGNNSNLPFSFKTEDKITTQSESKSSIFDVAKPPAQGQGSSQLETKISPQDTASSKEKVPTSSIFSNPNQFSVGKAPVDSNQTLKDSKKEPVKEPIISEKKEVIVISPQTVTIDKKEQPKKQTLEYLQRLKIQIEEEEQPNTIFCHHLQNLKKNLRIKLKNMKEDSQDANKITLNKLKSFYQAEEQNLNNPESLVLGAPLDQLLEKAASARDLFERYEQLVNSSSGKQLTKKEIEEVMEKLDSELERSLFFVNMINPHKMNKNTSKMASSKRNLMVQSQLEHLDGMFEDRTRQLDSELGVLQRLLTELEEGRKRSNLNSSMISSRSMRKVFNFNDFQVEEVTQSKVKEVYQSTIKAQKEQQPRTDFMVIKIKDIIPKPKFNLPNFTTEPPKQQPSSKPAPKLPSSVSFSTVQETKGLAGHSKSKEKVVVPLVNTKMPELKEKDAVSEVFSKSDADDDHEFALPTTARQISKIQPKEGGKKQQSGGVEKISIFNAPKKEQIKVEKKNDKKTQDKESLLKTAQKSQGASQMTKGNLPGLKPSKSQEAGGLFFEKNTLSNQLGQSKAQDSKKKPEQNKVNSLFGGSFISQPKTVQLKKDDQKDEKSKETEPSKSGSLFGGLGGGTGLTFGSKPVEKTESKTKLEAPQKLQKDLAAEDKKDVLNASLGALKVDEKKDPEVPKQLTFGFSFASQKNETKPGLFGSQDKNALNQSLFGSKPTTNPLLGDNKPKIQNEKKPEESQKQKSELPQTTTETKPAPTVPPKTEANSDSKTLPANVSIFGAPVQPALPSKVEEVKGNQVDDAQAQSQNKNNLPSDKPSIEIKPQQSPSQTGGVSIFSQNPQNPPQNSANLFGSPSQTGIHGNQPSFGGTSTFLTSSKNVAQSTGFDPKAMSFGGSSTQKSFASFNQLPPQGQSTMTGASNSNLFNQSQNQNQLGNPPMFGNNNQNTFGGGNAPSANTNLFQANNNMNQNNNQGSNIFNQNQLGGGNLFANNQGNSFAPNSNQQSNTGNNSFGQPSSMFGQGNNSGGGNFLQNFNLNQASTPSMASAVNPNLMQMRK